LSAAGNNPGGGTPDFSIIVVSLNGAKRIGKCLRSVAASFDPARHAVEVIVVDNGSGDATSAAAEEADPNAQVIRAERNLGFAGGNNLGIEASRAPIVILLNDDAYPEPGWLDELGATAAATPDWGVIGCLLLYPESRQVQHAGGLIEPNGLTKHTDWGAEGDDIKARAPHEAEYVSGAAFAINRSLIDAGFVLDADYFPIYFEETDYCLTARRLGFRVMMSPRAVVLHDESQVTVAFSPGFLRKYHRNRLRFLLINYLRPQLQAAFRYELRWLFGHKPWDQLKPLLYAYAMTGLNIGRIRRARRDKFAAIARYRGGRGLAQE